MSLSCRKRLRWRSTYDLHCFLGYDHNRLTVSVNIDYLLDLHKIFWRDHCPTWSSQKGHSFRNTIVAAKKTEPASGCHSQKMSGRLYILFASENDKYWTTESTVKVRTEKEGEGKRCRHRWRTVSYQNKPPWEANRSVKPFVVVTINEKDLGVVL